LAANEFERQKPQQYVAVRTMEDRVVIPVIPRIESRKGPSGVLLSFFRDAIVAIGLPGRMLLWIVTLVLFALGMFFATIG
jgi:hypothetical protein